MVDIHFHLLPGIDDGPDTLETAVEMARMAVADGTTHIVATPHANAQFSFDPELIARRAEEVRSLVGDRVTILTGCDFHLSFENLQDIQQHRARYTINRNGYLLVEFASYSIPPQIEQSFHELQLAGITPIITHPERNRILRRHTDWLDRWVSHGCVLQVTAGSLLGRFGPNAREAAAAWLDTDRIHFLASDAHNTTSRPPELAAAYAHVADIKGEETARALCIENPLAAVEGRPLPWLPEPSGTVAISAGQKRKKFWFF
ncbi:MAG TPA: CpsB/CapC family capsule biosynthesis tyrosine phosphatase [Candidatus Dormibacteraeota bacterium]|nr:CpsB/CapC family capsule biosynthesis tyrosine phosphatase [Candidatus Dormibacteraeota bacterium]